MHPRIIRTCLQMIVLKVYDLLKKMGLTGREAQRFTTIHENMASSNIIAQFGAELKATNAKLDSIAESLRASMQAHTESTNARLDSIVESLRASMQAYTESTNARLDALSGNYDALDTKLSSTRWTIGIVGGALGLILTILGYLITSGV